MKAITIRQPWARLVADGVKDIENRSQNWRHRGRIAIHAGQNVDWDAFNDPAVQRSTGYPAGTTALMHPDYVYGRVIGVAILADCHPSWPGCCTSTWAQPDAQHHLVLHSAVQLPRPVQVSGHLGPWELPTAAWVDVARQLTEIGAA